MGAGQRELGERVVIELRGLPGRRGVATLASLRKAGLYVVRVGRLLEIGEMTAHACCRRPGEFPSDVAGVAIQWDVRSSQSEAGKFQMIKFGTQPGIGAMALFTGGRKASGQVIGASGRLIFLGMAGIALCSETLKLCGGRSLVAGSAIQRCVGSHQGKTVLVLVNLLRGNLPTLYAVALLTTGSELTLVDIRVAIGALVAYILKYRFDVALGARNSLMQPTQRVPGLIVVEFWCVSNRLPSAQGMAVLTGDIEGAVRTSAIGVGLRLPSRRRGADEKQAPDH